MPALPAALYLVADVGGTNTRVGLARDAQVQTGTIRRFRNDDYPGIEPILDTFLADLDRPALAGVCVDVAGPVQGGHVHLTNRDWQFSQDTLQRVTGAPRVALLNDLRAQGHAVALLGQDDCVTLRAGTGAGSGGAAMGVGAGMGARQNQACVVVNVGTGFNVAPVYPMGAGTVFVPPCEAGHADLCTRSDDDIALARFLEGTSGFASIEDLLSGRGLARLYAWHMARMGQEEARSVEQIVANMADGDPVAKAALATFARHFGAVCGDQALAGLAMGGVYLTGGLARATMPYLGADFDQAFRQKGRFSDLVSAIAVHVITDDYVGLKGCAAYINQPAPA